MYQSDYIPLMIFISEYANPLAKDESPMRNATERPTGLSIPGTKIKHLSDAHQRWKPGFVRPQLGAERMQPVSEAQGDRCRTQILVNPRDVPERIDAFHSFEAALLRIHLRFCKPVISLPRLKECTKKAMRIWKKTQNC